MSSIDKWHLAQPHFARCRRKHSYSLFPTEWIIHTKDVFTKQRHQRAGLQGVGKGHNRSGRSRVHSCFRAFNMACRRVSNALRAEYYGSCDIHRDAVLPDLKNLGPQDAVDCENAARRPLLVLIVRDHLIASGGTLYFHDVLPRIPSECLEVCFTILSERSGIAELFEGRGLSPSFIGSIGCKIWRLKSLLNVVDIFRPDLLYVSGPKSMLWARVAARLRGLPVIVLFNNALGEPAPMTWLQRRMWTWPTAGVAVSHAIKSWAVNRYRLPADCIEVIYGGRGL